MAHIVQFDYLYIFWPLLLNVETISLEWKRNVKTKRKHAYMVGKLNKID
jgi:hypothetical protein